MSARKMLNVVTSTSLVLASAALLSSTSAQAKSPPAATAVTHWNAIALRTVYTQARLPVPVGSLYLGFTSLAVYDAVLDATKGNLRHGGVSAPAAAVVAAHDVLAEYVPSFAVDLDADLTTDLAAIPAGPAKQRGIAAGARSADDMIASRIGDHRFDPDTFQQTEAPGVWRPTLPGRASMAVPWLAFVTPLLLDSSTEISVDGPDALGSAAYTADFDEVRTMGARTGSARDTDQTAIARFYNANAVAQYGNALMAYAAAHPRSIVTTARTFALVNVSVADALIATWWQKYHVGFWRPVTAIQQADTDSNADTTADPAWTPFADDPAANPPGAPVGTPPYPDYLSGHGAITNAFTEAVALAYGSKTTDLTVSSAVTGTSRSYTSLDALSCDAFHARIWLGIHFRDAMEDSVWIGKESARIADARLP
jgi:hypothetical protein